MSKWDDTEEIEEDSETEDAGPEEESVAVDLSTLDSQPETCAECGTTVHIDHTQLRRRPPRIVDVLECGHRVNRD